MIDEDFAFGNTAIHRLDPRIKIIVAAAFSIVIAVADKFPVLLTALPFSCILVAIARLNVKAVLRRLLIVNTFIFFLWLLLPVSFPGKPLFSWGKISITREGIIYSLQITMKSNAIVIACMALLSTSPVFSLVHALHHLRLPDKLVHLFFFCFRYIHVIQREYLRLTNAIKVRCFEPKTDIHTYRTYSYLVGTLLLKSSDRSKRVYQAMICRGFDGTYWVLDHFDLRAKDLVALSVMLLYVLGLALLQWGKIL